MARDLDSSLATALGAGVVVPIFLAMLTFRSATRHVWSGVGELVVDAQTYTGVGSLASIGGISEGISVQADGTTVTLSGLEAMIGESPDFLSECLGDIRSQAPAKLWFGLLDGATLIEKYMIFSGVIDKPSINVDPGAISITLALESKLLDLGRASARRYTSADQNLDFPDDSGFDWQEILNDISLQWGTS
jgi:hypothetical protein